MDRLRAALEEVVDIVKTAVSGEPRTRVEEILDEHLSIDEPVFTFSPRSAPANAIPTAVLNDLASRTNNIVDYPFILSRVWEVLVDMQHNPALMKKALHLLHFLLVNGSIQVLKDCQDPARSSFLQELAVDYNRYEFEQYKFSAHLDVGAGVRKLASDINNLMSDERELFRVRREAEKLHQSLLERGLRSPPNASPSNASFRDPSRPQPYSDSSRSSYGSSDDDLALRLVTHTSFDDEASMEVHDRRSRREKGRKPRGADRAPPSVNSPSVDLLGLETISLSSAAPTSSSPLLPQANIHKLVATI